MIERYNVKEISEIWENKNKYNNWLKIELAILEYYKTIGRISENDFNELKRDFKCDPDKIDEIEKRTKHDIFAFIENVSSYSNNPAKKWLHYGITSSDIVDTANALAFKQTNDIIYKDLINFIELLESLALKYKHTPQMGRTHGMHAEITSFGLKFALYYEEMCRNLDRFTLARIQIETGKISGAVGTYANTGVELQDFVCSKLDIFGTNISTQVIQRDRYAFYFSTINMIARTLDKIATELRHLARSEVHEISEGFSKGQKGSSAMPHKKNPISLENISGLSRLVLGYDLTSQLNVALWHERDISHSSNERVICLDATVTTVYMLRRMHQILSNMVVHEDRMIKNIEDANGLCFSQTVLLNLIAHNKLDRITAYSLIQNVTLQSINTNTSFKENILKDQTIAQYLSQAEIEKCFDYKYHLQYVDQTMDRIFKLSARSDAGRILMYRWEIEYDIEKIAYKLNSKFANSTEDVYLYMLLTGSITFVGKILTKLRFPCQLKTVQLSFYGDETKASDKQYNLDKLVYANEKLKGKNIVIVDDLIEEGKTIHVLKEYLQKFEPKEITTCVLCLKDKPNQYLLPDIYGKKIENVWIVGYGFDFKGKHRNDDFIAEIPQVK